MGATLKNTYESGVSIFRFTSVLPGDVVFSDTNWHEILAITPGIAGDVHIIFTGNFRHDGTEDSIAAVYKNDVQLPYTSQEFTSAVAGAFMPVALNKIVAITATDELEIKIKTFSGSLTALSAGTLFSVVVYRQ